MRSVIYDGASPFRALKTKSKLLKSILNLTGNQCSSIRAGVMWSRFLFPVMSRAAAFWTICKREMVD